MEFERRGGTAALWALGAWLAASAVAIAAALAWHLEYFRSPGPQFYRLILLLAPGLFGLALLYAWRRPRRLRRMEPWLLTGLALGAPLIWKPAAPATVLLMLCGALAAGRRLLELFRLPGATPVERLALSAGLGFGLWIPALLALGPRWGLWLYVGGALSLGAGALRRSGEDAVRVLRTWSASPALDHPLAGVLTALAFPFLGIVLMLALAPALAHDALMMHLPAALHYVAVGGLEPLPHLSSTYFPQGSEALMAAVTGVAGLPAAQLVQPLFFALALGAIARVAARAGASLTARYVGVMAAATLPFVAWTGGVAKNDMALALFQALALLCALAAEGERRGAWLRLGAFFLAASFSVKYTAAFGAAPLGLIFLWRLRGLERKGREALLWAGMFAGVAGIWLLRAYVLTGNPFYPVDFSWAVESLRPNAMRPAEWKSIPYWKIPWTVHFDGTVAFESPSANPLGFFLWLFAPLWLLVRRGKAGANETICLAFAWIYFFYWGSVWPVVRYAIVPIELVVILTAARLEAAWTLLPRGWRPALGASVAANGVAALLATMIFSVNGPQLELFAGRIDEKEYLRRTLSTYPVLEKLGQEWTPGDWTLSVGVTSAAYAPDPSRFRCEYPVEPDAVGSMVPRLLARMSYAFLIVPADAEGAAIVENLTEETEAVRLFGDAAFELYRLTERAP